MFNIVLTLGILPLIGMIGGAFIFGLLIQRRELAVRQRRILKLSKEMVDNHAEILDLQREFVALEKGLKASRVPVRPLKSKGVELRDAAL